MEMSNVGTCERGQSCNLLRESLQPFGGNDGLVGEIKRCKFQWETRDLAEKCVHITRKVCEVNGGEVGEPV